MYDHDLDEVEVLGWEEFLTRQWESIFVCYRSWTGLRTLGRRWVDLIEVGLGCSQEVADRLVHTAIIAGPDRGLQGAGDVEAVLSGMVSVVAGLRSDLTAMETLGLLPTGDSAPELLGQHARLLSFARIQAFGYDPGAGDAAATGPV